MKAVSRRDTYRWKDTQERLLKVERHTAMVAAIERELGTGG